MKTQSIGRRSRRRFAAAVFVVLAAALCVVATPQAANAAVPESWSQMAPATSPAARDGSVMAYDAASAQMILFGGQPSSSYTNETWNWTGSNWVQLTPATLPSARTEPSMAYDAALGKIVLFGGASGSAAVNDTWTWDGSTWTQLSPGGTLPTTRVGASMTYDASLGKLVLFGGRKTLSSTTYYNDTYTFDGTTWTKLSPTTSPTTRYGASFAYDPAAGYSILYSGVNSSTQNDCWIFSNGQWTQQTSAATNNAPDHSFSVSAYDPNNNQVVLVVGHEANTDTTWLWVDTTTGWIQGPTTGPVSRDNAAMAFDPRTNQMVLFGGEDASFAYLSDTWVYGAAPLSMTTSPSLTWSSTTLNGYDRHLVQAQAISTTAPVGSNWNISISANTQLTSGANTLPAVTVNGSNSNYAATTAPGVTCTGTGCSPPTATGGVTYPLTVPVSSSAIIYGALGNTGSGTETMTFELWATVPATAKPGSYSNTLTESINYGP